MRKNTNAFTFVELIIVLVILAILSTIGFVTYESYLSTGRDTKRVVELKNLHQSLGSFAIKSKLPFPTDKIDITSSGALISYHGNIDDTIGKTINFKGKLYDKEFDAYPVYVLGKNRKDFQLLNFVEDRSSLLESNVSKSYSFTDYQILTPTMIGKPLGVFLEDETNEPIHISENYTGDTNYDIISGTGVFNIQMSKNSIIDTSNTGSVLNIIPNRTCKRILEMGKSKGDGEYTLSLNGVTNIKAYCDMRTDGGGWIMILNYLHKGGTNPDLNTLNDRLPVKSKMPLGTDESGSKYWGHVSSALLSEIDFSDTLFYAVSSGHQRKVYFKTSVCNNYFRTGIGSCSGINSNFNTFSGNSYLPLKVTGNYSNQGDDAMTNFPFYWSANAHWGIKGNGNRWEVDDYTGGYGDSTHHQIYIR